MRIAIVATPALAAALPVLLREFERTFGHSLTVTYATAGAIADRMNDTDADVVATTKSAIDELHAHGRVSASGRRDIARVGLGVQIAKGGRKPVIDTVQAFRSALLAAKSIGYIDPAAGGAAGAHAARVLTQLGIAEAVAAKTRFAGGTALTCAVAEGEIELGLAPVSEIVSDSRVELVGPVPSALQEVTVLAAAVTATSTAPDAAQALVDFLASPAASAELARCGLR